LGTEIKIGCWRNWLDARGEENCNISNMPEIFHIGSNPIHPTMQEIKWQRMTSKKYNDLQMVCYHSGKFINLGDYYTFGLIRKDGILQMVLIEKYETESIYSIEGFSGNLPIIKQI
jgi:hypothetical protein